MENWSEKSAEAKCENIEIEKNQSANQNIVTTMTTTTLCVPTTYSVARISTGSIHESRDIFTSPESFTNIPYVALNAAATKLSSVSLSSDDTPKISPSPSVHEGPEFIKLKSSEKRCFKKALAQGFSRAEALQIAKAPKQTKVSYKRSLTPESMQGKHEQKKFRTQELINMGIIPNDFENQPFDSQAINTVQEAIIDAAIESNSKIKPEFEGRFPQKGWLKVVCSNLTTADWLQSNCEVLKRKTQLDLKIIEEIDFPRYYYVHGIFPQSQGITNEKILNTIEAQNNLKASEWQILNRECIRDSALSLSLKVDSKSWKFLKQNNGRIAYRFGHINLQIKHEKDVKVSEASPYSSKNFYHQFADDKPCTSRQAANYCKTKASLQYQYPNSPRPITTSSPIIGAIDPPSYRPTRPDTPPTYTDTNWKRTPPNVFRTSFRSLQEFQPQTLSSGNIFNPRVPPPPSPPPPPFSRRSHKPRDE